MQSVTVPPPSADRIARVLTARLLSGHTVLRLISLLLWLVFGLAYGGIAPWWMIAAPAALHLGSTLGFVSLSKAYARDPHAHSNEGWRWRYILFAGLTGIAYGGGGALLFSLPEPEPRLLVAAVL